MNHSTTVLFFLFLLLVSCDSGNLKSERNSSKESGVVDERNSNAPDALAFRNLQSSARLSINEVISQHWELGEEGKVDWNYIFKDSTESEKFDPSLLLFNDFKLTVAPRGKIMLGKWSLNKSSRQLLLEFPEGIRVNLFIKRIAFTNMLLTVEEAGRDMALEFVTDNLVHRNPHEDPFYPANCVWRIRPTGPESEDQIRSRVKNCIQFFALFFKDNADRRTHAISFDGLPNCFTWYNGGIAMQPEMTLDRKWIACFYSEEQAIKGYELIKTVLAKHQLKWPKNAAGWVPELQSILQQIHDQI
ncbi:MAG: hypothetical protein ACHQEM_04250 [Chitinophagales bacterium]